MMLERYVEGEVAMEAFGAALARACPEGAWIFLNGELGAGKTTLVRGMLRGLGHQGAVKSPTYTLVEPYTLADRSVFHLDLYRLADPEELEWVGIREMFAGGNLCLVEWPEQGVGMLPPPDLVLDIEYADPGRRIRLRAPSAHGETILQRWSGQGSGSGA